MRAGRLRHRVTLEFWTALPRTDSGATPSDWVPGATVWASLLPLSTRMVFAADEANSETTHTARLRYRQDVADATGETLRLRHDGRVYRLDGRPMDPDGKRRELEVRCHEWV